MKTWREFVESQPDWHLVQQQQQQQQQQQHRVGGGDAEAPLEHDIRMISRTARYMQSTQGFNLLNQAYHTLVQMR